MSNPYETPTYNQSSGEDIKITRFVHPAFIPMVILTNQLCSNCNEQFLHFIVLDSLCHFRLDAFEFEGFYTCPDVRCHHIINKGAA